MQVSWVCAVPGLDQINVCWWLAFAEQGICYGWSWVQFAVPQVSPQVWLISTKAICPTGTIPHSPWRLVVAFAHSCLFAWPGLQSVLPRWEGDKPAPWELTLMPAVTHLTGSPPLVAFIPHFSWGWLCSLPGLSALRCTRKCSRLSLELGEIWLSMAKACMKPETFILTTSLVDYLFNWKKTKSSFPLPTSQSLF